MAIKTQKPGTMQWRTEQSPASYRAKHNVAISAGKPSTSDNFAKWKD